MIPFLALFFSSLNVELKNEILYHIILLICNQVYVDKNKTVEYIGELVNYEDITTGWEII